jgi:hypothetical protein
MATKWGTDDQKIENSELHGFEWNHEVRANCTQTQGALQAHGVGVVQGLLVTAGEPGGLEISAGQCVAYGASLGYVFLQTDGTSVDLGDDRLFPEVDSTGDYYLLAGIRASVSPDNPDSRETGFIEWIAQPDSSLDGTVALAKFHWSGGLVTSVEDVREFNGLAALKERVDDLKTEIGDLDRRLDVLENAPGDGGGTPPGTPTTYLSQLLQSPDELQNAVVVQDNKLASLRAELLSAIEAGGRVPSNSATGLLAHRQAILIHQSAQVHPHNVEEFEGAYVAHGLYGEGTAGTVNHLVLNGMSPTDRGWTPSDA